MRTVNRSPTGRARQARRLSAGAIALAGLIDVVSAVTPPVRQRLDVLRRFLPLVVPQAAAVLVAVIGVALLLLASGVRRGQRRAWRAAVVLLLVSTVLHLLKGVDVEEATLLGALAWFFRRRAAFVGVPDRRSFVRARGGTDLARARSLVERHGGDTLAYFALRDDKHHFFWGESVVAYAVVGGVCLVSPDPIGPRGERRAVWHAFHRYADAHAWPVAVLGASAEWLPVYRAAGMRELYVGDEGVVDVRRFSLEGGRMKGLRQAVNRVERNGYHVEFYSPREITDELASGLRHVMRASRRGDRERGFSMTLGRAFDPLDDGALVAVAFGPSGEPVAFCQFVPATALRGYSLDLMRRTDGEHPNGVLDFVLVSSIAYLREGGTRALSLNFATGRAVLAGEATSGVPRRVERWFLQRLSASMQIESLWRFTAKYQPEWQPRYALYDAPEHVPAAALAVARAESFWELPLVGRFLRGQTTAGVSARRR